MAAFVNKTTFWNLIQKIALLFQNLIWLWARKPFYYRTDWLTSNVHWWHHLGSLYILGPSSAGTAASSLVDQQTTSIHQHKSAQRGANCIRRPSPFLSGLCVCVCVVGYVGYSGVEGRRKRRRLVRSVGCLRSRGGAECDGVWWELAKPTSLQAGVPSVTSAAAGNVSNPLHTHTNIHKHTQKYTRRDELPSLRSQQTT